MSATGHHVLPMKIYNTVFVSLLFLTGFTVWIAQIDFGILNTLIAMLVATVKATLVGMYFMHLKYEDKTNTVCILAGVFFLVVMYAFLALDVGSRVIHQNTL